MDANRMSEIKGEDRQIIFDRFQMHSDYAAHLILTV